MDKRHATEMHPYALLGQILAAELDARPPMLSRKRKRLRAALRGRLAAMAFEGEQAPEKAPGTGAA